MRLDIIVVLGMAAVALVTLHFYRLSVSSREIRFQFSASMMGMSCFRVPV